MPILSCQEPGTTDRYGASDFLLPRFCRLFSAAEREEAAVAPGAKRVLFFLSEGTIYFGVNFNRLWQFRTRKLPYCGHMLFFEENSLHFDLL